VQFTNGRVHSVASWSIDRVRAAVLMLLATFQ
jgi:hypothetical protein